MGCRVVCSLLATKCVTHSYESNGLRDLLGGCLAITYNAINYGQENGIDNRKRMKAFYQTLKGVRIPSCYKVAAITRACAVLKSRKKSEERGVEIRHRKPLRPMACVISGFFITMKGRLFVPLRRERYFDLELNRHVQQVLAGRKLRSLTITPNSFSFCYSAEVESIPAKTVFGVDRNEKSLTFGNERMVTQIDLNETVKIRQTTREVVGSFRRNDMRVRRELASKYWRRAKNRTNQILHAATNFMIEDAVRMDAAIALEDLTDINRMYEKGNGQGPDYRFRLNSWPHRKAWKTLEYKAAWKGITVIPLTKSETYGSSSMHWACGERLHRPAKADTVHRRNLWCQTCKLWVDRDVNAAIVLSQRGLARFASSHPRPKSRSQQTTEAAEKGLAVEAVKGNPTQTAILRVDASKLAHRPMVNATISHPKT
jgi:IS605 OrfB family transposase